MTNTLHHLLTHLSILATPPCRAVVPSQARDTEREGPALNYNKRETSRKSQREPEGESEQASERDRARDSASSCQSGVVSHDHISLGRAIMTRRRLGQHLFVSGSAAGLSSSRALAASSSASASARLATSPLHPSRLLVRPYHRL